MYVIKFYTFTDLFLAKQIILILYSVINNYGVIQAYIKLQEVSIYLSTLDAFC